jgi:dGTPase
MVQAIGFTHDLGHPPFGHGGEVALNYCMRDAGGFEGNGQTLRILGRLEKFSETYGANLTRRTMLGVLKYPVPFSRVQNPDRKPVLAHGTSAVKILDRDTSKPPKAYMDCDQDIVDWILRDLSAADRDLFTAVSGEKGKHAKSAHKSFDCSIMDLADDISFGVHDLEDAIAMGMISQEAFVAHVPAETCASLIERISSLLDAGGSEDHYSDLVEGLFGGERARKQAIGLLVNHFITEAEISDIEEFDEPLLRYRASLPKAPRAFLDALINAVRAEVIYSASVQQLEFKGQAMVVAVFEAFACDPLKLLPESTRARYRQAASETARLRVICDHIAGMTDSFLLKTYERLFSPRMGSVFDRL